MSRPSNEILFQLHYSYHIEILTNIFFLRATSFLWLVQLITGCLIIGNFLPALFSGIIIVICTYLLSVYRTHGAAAKASLQACRYYDLICRLNTLTDSELREQLHALERDDSRTFNVFFNPARIRAYIMLGWTEPAEQELSQLNRREKLFAWLAGDIPR
ncbi:hypothetical protein OD218_005015 [Salmonella enterica]|nr:hypothetical protein [Salmonella enterica subsp. diarizonae serovar 48:i:z]EJQ7406494.1 hypothetical protein [Salmonella enterica]EJQ8218248.1 hypothetical protein [Salmonella enterica]EJX3083196.1 hypothetical protein [Salmonella enterica]EJX3102800.1 hypothetical protein [Salmonella enterica]